MIGPQIPLLLEPEVFSPYHIPGLVTAYDFTNSANLKTTANAISFATDLSGNSLNMGLVLNGAQFNSASTPSAAASSFTGDMFIRVKLMPPTWTPSSYQMIVSKTVFNYPNGYELRFQTGGTGKLEFSWSPSGSQITKASTMGISFAPFTLGYVGVTFDVDNGATGNDIKFWTSTDGVTWIQLGTTVTTAGITSIASGSVPLMVGQRDVGGIALMGTAIFYHVELGTGTNIAGVAVVNFDTSGVSRGATSFVAPITGETWTLSVTGDLGARICGARDLAQLTGAKQPVLQSIGTAAQGALLDGVDDYLKSAPFALVQPETVVVVGQQVTWTSGDYVLDGNTLTSGALVDHTGTPKVAISAGAFAGDNANWVLAANAVVQVVINNASSSLRVNRGTAVAGTASTANMGGFTLGAAGDASVPANIQITHVFIFSTALDAGTLDKIVQWAAPIIGIAT